MVFNAAFNHISVISWGSVSVCVCVEETGEPGENHRPVASHWQTLSHNLYILHLAMNGVRTLVVIGTDCTGSWMSNYHHTITTTTTSGYRCLAPIATALCTVAQLYRGCHIYWWRKPRSFGHLPTTFYHITLHGNDRKSIKLTTTI